MRKKRCLNLFAGLLGIALHLSAQIYDGGNTTYNISGYVENFGAAGVKVGSTTPNKTLNISTAFRKKHDQKKSSHINVFFDREDPGLCAGAQQRDTV